MLKKPTYMPTKPAAVKSELIERLSKIDFSEAFEILESFYFLEKNGSTSHNFHVYKIKNFWFNEIEKGKNFEIRKDDRSSAPIEGDLVCLKSESNGYVLVRVIYVLHHNEASEFVKDGYFIFGFEPLVFKSEGVTSWMGNKEELK